MFHVPCSSNRLVPYLVLLSPIGAQTPSEPSKIADAKREFAIVFAHPDQPCKWQDNTSYSVCMGKEVQFIETHQAAFMVAIRGMATQFDSAPSPGAEREKILVNLDRTNAAWQEYRKNACSLQHALFQGGTGGGPAEEDCELAMDRSYMRQIASMFDLQNSLPDLPKQSAW